MPFRCVRCKKEIDKEFKACPHCGEPVTDFLRRYANDPVDGKYEIVERLGTGGMGEVYKVNHTFLGTTRVIKVIRPQISESKDAHDRFLREARTATKVQHQNVATLHDFSSLPDGSFYMVWEFIDGENIAQRIRSRGTLGPRYAVRIIIEALHGLEALHRAGIVHRDISPENIMITRGEPERVKVIDLGVAKVEDAEQATRVGIFVGKLRYASPEHLGFLDEGEKIDGRADLYSLAMVLYEMLTGRPPFEATSPHEYVLLHSRETQFKPLDLPADLPGGAQLQTVLARALERDRTKRYATAREFAAALEEVEKSLPDPNVVLTVNMPTPSAEADATWRPARQSVTSQGETLRTPLPGAPAVPAGPTLRTPLPTAHRPPVEPTVVVAQAKHGGLAAFLVIGLIVAVAATAIVLLLMRKPKSEAAVVAESARPAQTQTVAPAPAPPQSTVDVVTSAPIITTTTQEPVLMQPVPVNPTPVTPAPVTPAPAPATPRPAPLKPPAQVPAQPKPEPEPRPAPASASVRTYVDGDTGDSDVNEALIADLQRQLQGVKNIAVRGSGEMYTELLGSLRREGVTVVDNADTVIDFDATLERLGRGRKRRSARASVLKGSRVIFRYELPAEEYRVGDSPAEAFVRVFTDAYGQ